MRQSFSGRPRRICFPFVGDTLGGSHLSSIELFSELRKTGCDVVIVLHKSGRLEDELLRQEVDFNIVPVQRLIRHVPRYPTHWFQAVSTVIKLMSFCIRENIEVIHTNDGRIHVTWGIVAALTRRNHIWHQRTVLFKSRIVDLVMRRAKKIICISEFVKQSLPPELTNRSIVVPNLIGNLQITSREVERARACLVQAQPRHHQTDVIGIFGNLSEVKDPSTGLLAFSRYLTVTQKAAILCYFGEDRGNYRASLRELAIENGISDCVLLMEFQRPVAPWIAACDLILAPSVCDAFGRTLLEAMSLGVPIVASNAGGHRELVNHGVDGILVESRNHQAFAEAMQDVLLDPALRHSLVENGRSKVRDCFERDSVVRRIQSTYF